MFWTYKREFVAVRVIFHCISQYLVKGGWGERGVLYGDKLIKPPRG